MALERRKALIAQQQEQVLKRVWSVRVLEGHCGMGKDDRRLRKSVSWVGGKLAQFSHCRLVEGVLGKGYWKR